MRQASQICKELGFFAHTEKQCLNAQDLLHGKIKLLIFFWDCLETCICLKNMQMPLWLFP